MTRFLRLLVLCLIALTSVAPAAAPTAPNTEFALLIPRSMLVRQIEREDALSLLFAYGSVDSYAAGYTAGRAAVLREWLALLDALSQPPSSIPYVYTHSIP